ncbi:MAG: thermonuclease family protein [Halobacteria archaeon]|nr:thermonuclease family protein [Halobacteria archaeon]
MYSREAQWAAVGVVAVAGFLILSTVIVGFVVVGGSSAGGDSASASASDVENVDMNAEEIRQRVVNFSEEIGTYRYKRGDKIGYVDVDDENWVIRNKGELIETNYDGSRYTRNGRSWEKSNQSGMHNPLGNFVDAYFRSATVGGNGTTEMGTGTGSQISVTEEFTLNGNTFYEVRTTDNSARRNIPQNATHIVREDGRITRMVGENGEEWSFYYNERLNIPSILPDIETQGSTRSGRTQVSSAGGGGGVPSTGAPNTDVGKIRNMSREAGRLDSIVGTDTVRVQIAQQGSSFTKKVVLEGLVGVNPNGEIDADKFGENMSERCLREVAADARKDMEGLLDNVTFVKVSDTVEVQLAPNKLVGYVYLENRVINLIANYTRMLNYRVVEKGYADVEEGDFPLKSDFEDARDRARKNNRGIWRCD